VHRTVVAIGFAIAWLLSSEVARADDAVVACVQAAEDAQSQRSSHQLRAARLKFLLCAQESCPPVVRNDCTGWLADVDKLMPSIVVQARDTKGVELTDVRVMVDGEVLADRLDGLAIAVDPGVHLFQFERAGVPPLQQQILIREGEKGRAMPITLAAAPAPDVPPPPSRRPPPLTYVFSGLAVGGFAGFTYFGLKGKADADEISTLPCAATRTCDKGRVANARRELNAADISLGVGLLSLGAAAYVFFSDRARVPPPATGLQTSFVLLPGTARVSVRASF
jgi:hypothetical protein